MFSDETVIPEWLNQDYFDKVIRSHEKDDTAKVIKFDIISASKVSNKNLFLAITI